MVVLEVYKITIYEKDKTISGGIILRALFQNKCIFQSIKISNVDLTFNSFSFALHIAQKNRLR